MGPKMAEVVQNTQQEFWRPPLRLNEEVALQDPRPAMAEACARCGTEFLLGSRFCHTCGNRRPEAINSSSRDNAATLAGLWERAVRKLQTALAGFPWINIKLPSRANFHSFQQIKTRIGLPTLSLIAFLVGLACVAGALLSGIATVKNWNDFYAIQLYRAEWLLAATASFVAGILLKKPSRN